MHRDGKWNGGCQELQGERIDELLFNRFRVSVLEHEKSSGDWPHSTMSVLNTTELWTWKWRTRQFCVRCILPLLKIKKKKSRGEKENKPIL